MAFFGLFHRRKACLLLVLFVSFVVFTANILDLRDELQLLPCSNGILTSNITTGIRSGFSFDQALSQTFCGLAQESPVLISSIRTFPTENRAPPTQS
jgi:hypothetical protein